VTAQTPQIAAWNLALRFGLELAALAGLAWGAWSATDGAVKWIAMVVAPVVGAAIWGVFNVRDDPSRSGNAVMEVPGLARLCVETLVLGCGALGMAVAGWWPVALAFLALVLFHYAFAWDRVKWLLQQ
jgi:hypothetical protein